MEWMKDYGLFYATSLLVAVTVWYSYATYRMARLMGKDMQLRTVPRIGFKAPIIHVSGWRDWVMEQGVVNTGPGFVTLERVVVEWWAFDRSAKREVVYAKEMTPVILRPGQEFLFTFTILERQLGRYREVHAAEAAAVISGIAKYDYSGADGVLHSDGYNLPRAGAQEIEQIVIGASRQASSVST